MRPGSVERENRKAWDASAGAWKGWVENLGLTAAFFRRGGVSFESVDIREDFQATRANRRRTDNLVRKLAGPVRGKSILVAPCGQGEEALSWANLGGRVWGLDQSPERLRIAREKAVLADLPVCYVRGSLLAMSLRPSAFDLIYTGHGSLTWIPDLPSWARQISKLLKPGGRFLLFDFHPFLTALSWRGPKPRVSSAYFNQKPQRLAGPLPRLTEVEVNWKISDILNALGLAGLALRRMEELPPGADRRRYFYKIPHRMILLFQKGL